MQNICSLLIERGQVKKDTSFRKCYDHYLESRDPHKFVIRTAIFQIYHCILSNFIEHKTGLNKSIANSREESQLLMEVAKNFKDYLPVINCIFYEQVIKNVGYFLIFISMR